MGFGRWLVDQFGGTAENDRQFNSAEAQKNRQWQEQMSNSAHQREVADLRAAGLNPVLSATGGSGASVPSSTPASVSGGSNGNLLTSAIKVGALIAGVALKNPKVAAIGFGQDINSASKRNRYS